ncbi:hypothetical protein [Piscirickettsia litoralis]|uniref:Solute-binding protein family 3/N-terminal domain-containing protein n=1 Tax=Piscirickettsia litoralis TaxID=1891921 RepID=A0ABX3A3T0_9GAMM|nr:hypothetical protein [Piscirickettsia litoralis]ODN42308.1 hypothetical protein BGC07_04385 [Piscirickettsia litoralis]
MKKEKLITAENLWFTPAPVMKEKTYYVLVSKSVPESLNLKTLLDQGIKTLHEGNAIEVIYKQYGLSATP